MKRRQFIKYSAVGGGTFIVNLGLLKPHPAQAISLGPLFGILLKNTFIYYTEKRVQDVIRVPEIQLANRQLTSSRYPGVLAAAQVNETQKNPYRFVAGSEKQDSLGANPAYNFPRIERSQPTSATFGGPTSFGMTVASQYMRENENDPTDRVQASVLPRVRGGSNLITTGNWDQSSFDYYENDISEEGVLVRYDAVEPRPGGFGVIDTTVNTYRTIRVPKIRIDFPKTQSGRPEIFYQVNGRRIYFT